MAAHADGFQHRVLELVDLTVVAHQLLSRLERPLLNKVKIGAAEMALTSQQFGLDPFLDQKPAMLGFQLGGLGLGFSLGLLGRRSCQKLR
jgi:hypothetical protein